MIFSCPKNGVHFNLFETRDIEMHIDAGNYGMTSKTLPGLAGYVIGEGFIPVAKPYFLLPVR